MLICGNLNHPDGVSHSFEPMVSTEVFFRSAVHMIVDSGKPVMSSPWKRWFTPPPPGIFEDDFPFPQVGYVNSLEGNSSCLGYPVTRYQGTNPSPSPLFGRPHQHQPRPHVTRLMSPETSEEGPSPRVFTGIWDCNNKCLQLGFPGFGLHKIPKKKQRPTSDLFVRWWQLKYFLECSPLLGKMIQFDEYFSDGLQPPTSFFFWGRGKIACIKRWASQESQSPIAVAFNTYLIMNAP